MGAEGTGVLSCVCSTSSAVRRWRVRRFADGTESSLSSAGTGVPKKVSSVSSSWLAASNSAALRRRVFFATVDWAGGFGNIGTYGIPNLWIIGHPSGLGSPLALILAV